MFVNAAMPVNMIVLGRATVPSCWLSADFGSCIESGLWQNGLPTCTAHYLGCEHQITNQATQAAVTCVVHYSERQLQLCIIVLSLVHCP